MTYFYKNILYQNPISKESFISSSSKEYIISMLKDLIFMYPYKDIDAKYIDENISNIDEAYELYLNIINNIKSNDTI